MRPFTIIPFTLLIGTTFIVACSEQPTAVSPDLEAGPDFARGGIPGPPPGIILPEHIGPPPRARGRPGPPPRARGRPGAGPPTFLSDIVAVGAGYSFSCALRSDGAAFCWGDNWWGQLGGPSAETCDRGPFGDVDCSSVPIEVSGNHTFDQLIVGDMNACGVTAGGSVYCWGANDQGQLGAELPTGLGQFSSVPVPVSGGHSFNNLSVGLRTLVSTLKCNDERHRA